MKKYLLFLLIFVLSILYLVNKQSNLLLPHYQRHLGSTNHIVAHRGFSSLEYENSFESIDLANKSNCTDAIEIDIRLTNDGYLVLSHNNKLVLNKNSIKVSNISYEDFMNLKLRKPIPDKIDSNIFDYDLNSLHINNKVGTSTSLYEVLNIVKNKTLVIDIKYNKNIKKLNDKLLKIVNNKENVILQSSNINGLNDLYKKNPNIKYQYIINENEDIYNINNYLYGVSVRYNLIKYNLVDDLINRGLKVFVWTINDTETYKNIINEVKENSNKLYYVTDYPDILCNYDIRKFKEI